MKWEEELYDPEHPEDGSYSVLRGEDFDIVLVDEEEENYADLYLKDEFLSLPTKKKKLENLFKYIKRLQKDV
jgi:hypothetical protein